MVFMQERKYSLLGLRELNQEAFIIITAYIVGRLFDKRHLYGSGRLLGHF